MSTTDQLFDTLRELMAASNPGLVTKEDLIRVEERLDALTDLVADIEERLGMPSGAGGEDDADYGGELRTHGGGTGSDPGDEDY